MKIYGLLQISPTCTWSPLPWFMSDFPAQTAFWILNHFSVSFFAVKPAETLQYSSPPLAFFPSPACFVLTSHQPNWKIVKQTSGSLLTKKCTQRRRIDWRRKINYKSIFVIFTLPVKNCFWINLTSTGIKVKSFSSVAWRNEFLARFTINSLGN